MPYKTGKMKGELTTTEIRKLIKAHNVLVSIKIPKGAKREDIIALVEKNGYKIDHEKQTLRPASKGKVKKLPVVDMKKADKVLPKPKTAEEKAEAKKVRDMKKKEKEDKIKAEGVKQGAALQRVLAKKKVAPKKPTPKKNDDELKSTNVSTKLTKEQAKEIKKILKDNDKKKKLMVGRISITKDGKYLRVVSSFIKDVDELIKETNKIYKSIPLVYDNVIFTTNPYTPNPQTGEQDGVYRKPKMILKGEIFK
jgi:hypothetical protein